MEFSLAPRATDWVVVTILASLVFLVAARLTDSERTVNLLKLPLSLTQNELAARFNPVGSGQWADLFLSISWLSFISLALASAAFQLKAPEAIFTDYIGKFFLIFFVIALFLILKNLLATFLAYIFELDQYLLVSENQFLAYLMWLITPALLSVLLIHFSPEFSTLISYVFIGLTSGGLLVAIFKSIGPILKASAVPSYIILYICALEISPTFYLFYILQNF
jgi:hypothetical protein